MKKQINNHNLSEKSLKQKRVERHTMDIYGDHIFHKKPDDVDVEDVYHDPKVPGKFAGDC